MKICRIQVGESFFSTTPLSLMSDNALISMPEEKETPLWLHSFKQTAEIKHRAPVCFTQRTSHALWFILASKSL